MALNTGECEALGQKPPINTVDLWINPGGAAAESSANWGAPPPAGVSQGVPVTLASNLPQVKDVKLMDADDDGDLDVVATWTNALSANITWMRNPLIPPDGGAGGWAQVVAGASDGWRFYATGWEERPLGHVDTGADMLAIGDIDGDGFEDVVVRSSEGQIIQWFRRPQGTEIVQPEFPPDDPTPDRFDFPWPVYTLTEFSGQEPAAIGLGDLTGNGVLDLVLSVEGGVWWYEGPSDDELVFDAWPPNPIIQDEAGDADSGTSTTAVPGAGVGVDAVDTSTNINALLVVDLDGDLKNDIIGTLDRQTGSGLADDRIVWYRNTRTDDE